MLSTVIFDWIRLISYLRAIRLISYITCIALHGNAALHYVLQWQTLMIKLRDQMDKRVCSMVTWLSPYQQCVASLRPWMQTAIWQRKFYDSCIKSMDNWFLNSGTFTRKGSWGQAGPTHDCFGKYWVTLLAMGLDKRPQEGCLRWDEHWQDWASCLNVFHMCTWRLPSIM